MAVMYAWNRVLVLLYDSFILDCLHFCFLCFFPSLPCLRTRSVQGEWKDHIEGG